MRGAATVATPDGLVPAMAHTVTIFDLDGTIACGDTFLHFLGFVLRRRPWRLARCAGLPGMALRAGLGAVSRDDAKRRLLTAIAGGCTRAVIESLAVAFDRKCRTTMLKSPALDRIAWHRRQGHRLILATGSLDLYANALGEALGFDDIVCTRAAYEGDVVSGGLQGGNLRGEAKVAAIRALPAFNTPSAPFVFAYTDHHSDLPLLRFADHGVAVDPSRRLAHLAAEYGLTTEYWTLRGRRSRRHTDGRQRLIDA